MTPRLTEGARDPRILRQDPALGMVGAFRPMRKGMRGKLDVQMAWGDAVIRWRGPDQLSITDQSVLFAVMEQAMLQWRDDQQGCLVGADDALWQRLEHKQAEFAPALVRVTTSFRRLAQLCGHGDGGTALAQVRAALQRLTETTLWVRKGQQEGSSRLLAWTVSDEHRVALVLNWRLTNALQGLSYARVSMTERALLRSEPAQALHAVLSCKVDLGKAWDCQLQDLQRYVWGDTLVEGPSRRKRYSRLRDVLAEIQALPGWTARVNGNTVRVARGSANWRSTKGAAKKSENRTITPVVSITPRRNAHETPSTQGCPGTRTSNEGAGFEVVDVSVQISQRR